MSPQGVYPAADVCAIGDEISSTYEGRHITLYADNLSHSDALDPLVVTKGYPVWWGDAVGVAFETQVLGENPLIAVDTEGIWCQDVYGRDDEGDSAVIPGDALFINTTTGLISKITDSSTQLPFGYALGHVTLGETETIAVKVHWDPGTPDIESFANGDVSFATWGAVLAEAYHIYFNDDYSCYIGSSANNVLMIGTAAGSIEFRCGAHGAAFTIDNDMLSTPYLIRVTGNIDFGAGASGSLHLPQKTDPITMPTEGQIWYNATQNKLQFCTASGVSLETVTSA